MPHTCALHDRICSLCIHPCLPSELKESDIGRISSRLTSRCGFSNVHNHSKHVWEMPYKFTLQLWMTGWFIDSGCQCCIMLCHMPNLASFVESHFACTWTVFTRVLFSWNVLLSQMFWMTCYVFNIACCWCCWWVKQLNFQFSNFP